MAGVRRAAPLTLGWMDLPRHVLVRDDSDEQVRVPVSGVLLQTEGGWLLLDTGFNTALITDAALRRRFQAIPRCAASPSGQRVTTPGQTS